MFAPEESSSSGLRPIGGRPHRTLYTPAGCFVPDSMQLCRPSVELTQKPEG